MTQEEQERELMLLVRRYATVSEAIPVLECRLRRIGERMTKLAPVLADDPASVSPADWDIEAGEPMTSLRELEEARQEQARLKPQLERNGLGGLVR